MNRSGFHCPHELGLRQSEGAENEGIGEGAGGFESHFTWARHGRRFCRAWTHGHGISSMTIAQGARCLQGAPLGCARDPQPLLLGSPLLFWPLQLLPELLASCPLAG